jgi:pSer/pThr/pTyr-binding forkhead associated (FHA) protein
MLKILLKFNDKLLKTIETKKQELVIGRNPGSDIVIDNLGVSDQHARIVEQSGQYKIEDLDSTNGTFLNGKKIANAVLEQNSEILIGKHSLIIEEIRANGPGKLSKTEKTMKLETSQYKEMLKKQ